MSWGIVLMNMGGPHNLDEVELFLKNMFNDPNILPLPAPIRSLLAYLITKGRLPEARANYQKLGGRSPLVEESLQLVAKMQEALPESLVLQVMRYTPPRAREAILQLQEAQVDRLTLLPLYPHYSTTTTRSSLQDFAYWAQRLGYYPKRVTAITHFYDHPSLNELICQRIDEALEGASSREYDLIFTAHSLPQKIVERGDPYPFQVQRHVELLRRRLQGRFRAIHLAFQSKLGPVRWLEPSLDQILATLKGRRVLVYPLSFLLDNSETLLELHQEYGQVAQERGVTEYRVARCPNGTHQLVAVLKELVVE
ncbi:MAG: ferrochelatase [Nitratiruptor sp.]|nr:ferrochelatase [Nitratiruptor sp.]NPA83868.1 ferrochelatase [Campylobacterota bacterium]